MLDFFGAQGRNHDPVISDMISLFRRPSLSSASENAFNNSFCVASSCPSGRGFAPRFFQTSPRDDALALR
jgi:hypothetical protein